MCLTSFGIHRNPKWHVKSKHENKIPLNVMDVMVGHKKHLKINMPTSKPFNAK
jgi:intergrase/recombinase